MTTTLYFNEANQLIGESYSGGTLGGLAMTNLYDAYLRRTYLAAKKGTSTLASAAFGYDTGSRLSTVTDGTWNSTYTYLANSPLVSQITHKQSTTTRMTETRQYDLLNRLTSISSTPAGAGQLPVGFVYHYNDANQRTRGTLEDGSFWIYEYDRLGQVVSGKRYWMDGSPVPAQQFEYGFDDIGNRTSTMAGGDSGGTGLRSAAYSANDLNQYTNRTVPGAFDVAGIANAQETVTVNGSAADYRRGEYFQKLVGVDNATGLVWTNVSVTTSGGGSSSGNVFVPQTPENYRYDLDGNLTNDGRWTYIWDAENRLIQMTPLAGIPDADVRRLNFGYDYQGRRVWKRVDYKVSGNWTTFYERKFVYDGWNLIAELWTNDGVVKKFLWGLDLSGTEQGAGGVGGLLKVWDYYTWKDYFAGYDGNGNVTLLTAGSDGTVGARYEYGAFGEPIRSSGSSTIAASTGAGNPFRFSTKYTDAESDFLYYGHRYYNPSTGRWLSRDPLGDVAFGTAHALSMDRQNLQPQALLPPYLFARNNPINIIDLLGLYDSCCCDAATIQNGRDWLISRYNLAKIYLAPYRAKQPNPLPETNEWSCLGVSYPIGRFMAPTPHCWTCYVADHWNRYPWWTFGRDDLNVIVCESHPKSGLPQKIVFDYWHDAPPAQDYSVYLSSHPTERTPDSLPFKAADCSKSQVWPINYMQLDPIVNPTGPIH